MPPGPSIDATPLDSGAERMTIARSATGSNAQTYPSMSSVAMLDASGLGSHDRVAGMNDASAISWDRESDGHIPVPDVDRSCGERSLDNLVQRLVERGDVSTALRHIMRDCQEGVYKLCCRRLADSILAEDVCQQIFMDVLRDLQDVHEDQIGRAHV